MSATATEREQEQVIGTLNGIIQKGPDKWQAVVLPDGKEGTNYTKNLWTKDEKLIATLATMIGQRLAYLCNASHWTMNDGTPVRSLWIETVGAPSADLAPPLPQNAWEAAQQAQAVAQPASNLPPQQMTAQATALPTVQVTPVVTQGVKEERIMREAASKVAAIMLTHVAVEERTMSTLLVLSERLVAYYKEGLPTLPQMPDITLDDLIVQATPRTVDEGPPPLPADDGIPF